MPDAPIGSYFESVGPELTTGPRTDLPWARLPHQYFATGRQALEVAVRDLLARGVQRFYLPEYLCDSMLAPFARHQWQGYGLDDRLEPVKHAWAGAASGDAILLCNYFGRSMPASTVAAVVEARRRGALVIFDRTHAPFEEPDWSPDLTVISLRKTLPLHDGAVLIGERFAPPARTVPFPIELVEARRAAADHRQRLLRSGIDAHDALGQLRAFEDRVGGLPHPTAMSEASRQLLRALDLREIVRRRRRNAQTLIRALDGSSLLAPLPGYSGDVTPAYVSCRTRDARALQTKLASQAIYCPIHWPRPDLMGTAPWRNDLISLPVDHRYQPSDMMRIAEAIARSSEEEPS